MKRPLAAGIALLLALGASACGKAEEQGGGSGEGSTGPGVTQDSITLGALVDLTAVFAANSKSILEGTNLYWDGVNAEGGVCGRQVKIDAQDHKYDPQTAVSLYRDMSSQVLAISPLLGSSVITALKPSIEEDGMVVGMAAWTSDVLPDPLFQITGATYDLEQVNALDWLTREQGVRSGDSVGMIYFQGDYGDSALKGAQYAADELGLTLVSQQVTPADTDLTTQVTGFRDAGVKAILVAGASPQTASAASVAASLGLDVPIVGNTPSFTPQLLSTPAGPALEANFYTSTSVAPPSLQQPGVQEFLTAYQSKFPDGAPILNGSMYGYAAAGIMRQALDGTCDDLTREGLQKSLRSIDAYDSQGAVAGTLDYTDPAVPPTRETYISKADASAPGGLTAVGDPFASQLAESYSFGG